MDRIVERVNFSKKEWAVADLRRSGYFDNGDFWSRPDALIINGFHQEWAVLKQVHTGWQITYFEVVRQ